MPFSIWCDGCEAHIGMGVRYNAEKKKVDKYYTTPIYEFKMKCHLCNNYFRIRTDPKNFDYELVEGCRRQERRWQPTPEDSLVMLTQKEAAQKLATDSMYKLEHATDDKVKATTSGTSLQRLEDLQGRWRDDFAQNQALRAALRTEKREAKNQLAVDDALRARGGMSIELLPETEADRTAAKLIALYRTRKTIREKQVERKKRIMEGSIFTKRKKAKKPTVNLAVPSGTISRSREKSQNAVVLKETKRRLRKEIFEQKRHDSLKQQRDYMKSLTMRTSDAKFAETDSSGRSNSESLNFLNATSSSISKLAADYASSDSSS